MEAQRKRRSLKETLLRYEDVERLHKDASESTLLLYSPYARALWIEYPRQPSESGELCISTVPNWSKRTRGHIKPATSPGSDREVPVRYRKGDHSSFSLVVSGAGTKTAGTTRLIQRQTA
jgi:hypothetical protein